ncbi:hypothetical protein PAA8504_00096 [Palleronia abyssalis]|uniref:Uncharacterized protein n=1 Tax=Palleronia abyssalis TaxID=1501240 RepID=A0A2R8BQE2_9RHOB|nr:hypothetical protein PAA8504_00096 [Palleronia abyssalis]
MRTPQNGSFAPETRRTCAGPATGFRRAVAGHGPDFGRTGAGRLSGIRRDSLSARGTLA